MLRMYRPTVEEMHGDGEEAERTPGDIISLNSDPDTCTVTVYKQNDCCLQVQNSGSLALLIGTFYDKTGQ